MAINILIKHTCTLNEISINNVMTQLHSKRTKNSADADKPARQVYRSVKVTKHSTSPYVRYSFLLCNSNFVFTIFDFKKVNVALSRVVSEIFNVEQCPDVEIRVRGHSRLLKVMLSQMH